MAAGPVDDHVMVARCDVDWERYALTGDRDLLDRVVAGLRAVVDEVPVEVPAWSTAAANLANALLELQARTAMR